MSNTSPPIEQQRFARSQTPESPRPVHVPEPANIPVLLNQMDQASNDLATYNIPTDQNFAHYGDTLENPAYKTSPSKDENDPFHEFLRKADSVVANPPEPTVPEYTNQAGQPQPTGQVASSWNTNGTDTQFASNAQSFDTNQAQPTANANNEHKQHDISTHEGNARMEEDGTQNILADGNTADSATEVKPEAGVDYQSLLDTITQSTSTAPPTENLPAITTDASVPDAQTSSLPSFPGLPKKPPPLDTQTAFPTYVEHAQAQQPISASNEALSSYQAAANGYAANTNANSTGQAQMGASQAHPANPFDTGMTNEQAIAMHMQYSRQGTQQRQPTPPSRVATEPSDRPWSPRTQAIYDSFLESERLYVTEGIWDRFPLGSRLFVGNLPSEKVTKRDLFHRFHRFGRLAQISIKQAYGFVQYHEAESCKAALDAEQGVEIRGRKVHLEISKPQKGSKASQQQPNKNQSQNNRNQNQNRRRSRSPQRRSYSDYRDEPRTREVFRDRRSPSPPRYRRDDRAGSRDDRRSPVYGSGFSTPQSSSYDDEASLPYPRRDPRYVPDLQIIVLDGSTSQAFVNWVEDGFKRKGLQVGTTWLNQRTPLSAVVKRQIVEGVQAVVKLASHHQARSKVPLQVFDRSHGTSNVTFNEYVDLDVPVAADVVLQARQKERGNIQAPRPQFPPPFPPAQSPYQQQSPWQPPHQTMPFPPPPPQHYQYPPQPQQPFRPPQPPQPPHPQYPTPNSATSQPPNLQELLANLKGGTAPPTPQSAHSVGQPNTPYGQPPPPQYPPQQYGGYPQGYPQPQYQQPPPPQQQPQQNGQQNVQYILDQMARNR
ncbi:nuclear polyadenylated RNA-binding protein 3 [Knufia fluminis]|uniref:Nuclear polyadenylated RNA-binding protein 3 n=1 Tax=Knufia fluminis TaxID=191047 RepID=A0AAN8FFP8_9EURO|nr:nuclear polyadenylated RNA-binding protein 3 [Knufia fluminis]